MRLQCGLKLTYQPFNREQPITTILHPYYLKEYNQRWFLFGLNNEYKSLSTYALDRIEDINISSVKFIPNTTIDFSHFFDDVIGVTRNTGKEPELIKLLVDKEQLPYLLSKPLHKSQQLIETREDGGAIISINVIPNFELQQLLLSLSDRVVVLSPASLREDILCRIKNNLGAPGFFRGTPL